jgi:hypothetical protein
MAGDCLCLMLGIECWCTRRGPGGFSYRPHGTTAAARRHYRRGERACEACRRAERDARDARREAAAARVAAWQAANRAALLAALPSCNQHHREAA